jgi:membrane protein required for colicin V production
MPHTAVDIIVVAVILISAILAFIRGLTREALSLGTWLLAIYLAFTQYPHVTPYLEEKISNPMLRDFTGGLIIFGAVLLIFLPVGFYLRSFVKGEQVTAIDRSLGFVFGAARGYLLIAILYLIVTLVLPEEKLPAWLKEANTRPALAFGAETIRGVLPAEQRDLLEKQAKKAKEKEEKAESSSDAPKENNSSLDGKVNQLDQIIQNSVK